MKKLLALLLLCSSISCLPAQNLVRNPGFEDLASEKYLRQCAFSSKTHQFNETVQGWHTFQMLTPDIISKPDTDDCIFQAPYQGQRMLGFINYYPKEQSGWFGDYHELVHGSLQQPLQKGQTYELSFWVKRLVEAPLIHLEDLGLNRVSLDPIAVASSNLGIWFSEQPVSPQEYFQRSIEQFNIRPHLNIDTLICTSARQWIQIRIQFEAPNNAQFFVMGNFYRDRKALSSYVPTEGFLIPPQITYYCIDNYYIGPPRDNLEETLNNTGKYTFRSVHFPTGSAELQAEAFPELDALSAYLRKQPSKRAEIAGHTDNVGNAVDNQQLSEARARSVYAYLIGEGVPKDQLTFRGYGEAQPVASNEEADGRRQNRRVECVLQGD